jgi:hypothetical protein
MTDKAAASQPDRPNPWYREPWPWILISITGLGVIAGSTLAFIGISSPPEMVRGEYHRLAKFITESDQRADQARALGLSGDISVDGDTVFLRLAALDRNALPEQLIAQFRHPATSDGDRTVVMQRRNASDYRGVLPDSLHERSHVVVSDLSQTWVLSGRLEGDPARATPVEARLP